MRPTGELLSNKDTRLTASDVAHQERKLRARYTTTKPMGSYETHVVLRDLRRAMSPRAYCEAHRKLWGDSELWIYKLTRPMANCEVLGSLEIYSEPWDPQSVMRYWVHGIPWSLWNDNTIKPVASNEVPGNLWLLQRPTSLKAVRPTVARSTVVRSMR